ncbi:putative ankyrin repeat-containing domain, PGG domain, ankyrin repeat-containing domain superfamily [Helianthus annuus]|uniref:Ankyrin repeat-containing domain, PGG domain, ankyrin repeat-containing domain superfamily n=1 Tax=Helianthus annuus TaxID=4232 RepID=A0A251V473_HELAN|nr:uncharacterized protein LOC110928765 [Helianthus annuus]KAF5812973.1 putative ankyrin repeat-containing domain, PGG domain, ankyrin repeat-containing domain superfamily [Helianthus annuus]KAJ0606767.1 putative ankyrin repeat-containing domain, PGG domain, ankyrin repeat-containing domain superfamily [Helianthus annuus]KAJ0766827.1 putative ankyrin repeat-containing domain, PGG domain, ankyrin repeat-containing domain superfamily [Helianthus annuus]KAJ0934127.1 putative ankyrin repeat-contain
MEMGGSSNALDVSAPTHEMKFMQASNINVSNFVSVKLSGHSNYKIWKAQIICLVESQQLLHIISDEHPFPVDKGVHLIFLYDRLVKGWIFGSVNQKVLEDLVDSDTAREVWVKLEYLFNSPISDEEGVPSNVLDVSTRTEELRYMLASTVDVSYFVSMKLSFDDYDDESYNVWKNDMLCLIESHDLLHIIHEKARFPWDRGDPMTHTYDKLVRGWILSSLDNSVLEVFQVYRSVQLLWRNLDVKHARQDKAGDDLIYRQASNINISEFVSVWLNSRNYHTWKVQMLRLIESQDLLHVIQSGILRPTSQCEKLVKGWICRAASRMRDELQEDCSSAREIWENLETRFRDDDSPNPYDVSVPEQDLKYIEASKVNVSNFVSVKLSGCNNYKIWKVRMLGLIESQGLFRITKNGNRITKKYDSLVKSWIFSAMNEQVLQDFYDLPNVPDIWSKLESTFGKPPLRSIRYGGGFLDFRFMKDSDGDIPEIDNTVIIRRQRLYEAAVDGCWWKAKSILKIHRNAATEAIIPNGNTILHVAVELGHNYLAEKLLEFLKDGEVIEKENLKGLTALHVAARVGNTDAVQLLVQKRKELLEIQHSDEERELLRIAFKYGKPSTCAYLLRCAPPSDTSTFTDLHQQYALRTAIITKQYDLAETLLNKFPDCALDDENVLMALTITFPTDLSFMESFIYPSFQNVWHSTVMEISLLFHSNFLDRCVDSTEIFNNMCCNCLGKNSMILLVPIVTLYPIYKLICLFILMLHLTFSMLYFLVWKFLAVTVRPIKNIEKKKNEYKEAKKILSLICDQMGSIHDGYRSSLIEAVLQGTYEVVDEILFKSPHTINCENDEGYNIVQLAIINRSEKVYNLIYHIIEHTDSYKEKKDSFDNTLVHLAGKLAPSFVLERTTGAALQLQRELLWFEEVKKLFLPFELRNLNKYNETPTMVFTKEHLDLMKQGETWMKTTAESCSITTALIVTVVFAAAITVPGGSNQESGIPLFKERTAFTIFAVSNAFSLFTSATALLLFLSILTARFSEKDFLVSLPRRLIFGLLMLFISTTAMMVAFGAILVLVFCDQRPWMLAPICAFACLPISVIVTIKLPLLVDVIRSTYSPIFGKQSYLESCKTNRKNTIFMAYEDFALE